jgi:predicted house-cleaning noncanonical NTP pyrophosphatase (MazG superfamily)
VVRKVGSSRRTVRPCESPTTSSSARIPEIIEADGHRAVTRVLQDGDYRAALLAKLVEEAREAENAPDDELAGELADVWEVV